MSNLTADSEIASLTLGSVPEGARRLAMTESWGDIMIGIDLKLYLRFPKTIPPTVARTQPARVKKAVRVFGGGSFSQ